MKKWMLNAAGTNAVEVTREQWADTMARWAREWTALGEPEQAAIVRRRRARALRACKV